MDLSTTYLGKKLRTPLVPSASPLTGELDSLKKLEDAGAAAVVLPSIFEEQIVEDINEMYDDLERGSESFAEAVNYFPKFENLPRGPEPYLEYIRKAKAALKIPVFASINGFTPGGWTDYARQVQAAGADGLELNLYAIPTDPKLPAQRIEDGYLETVRAVKSAVTIPLAVKLSPFFTNLAGFAQRLDEAGVSGLVLFNRFYQPDLSLEKMEVAAGIHLSTSASLRLPLRWIAILRGRLKISLGATSGIHTGADALKAVLAGADAAFLCSALLKDGIPRLKAIEGEMTRWLESKGHDSLPALRGVLSQARVKDPAIFERALYIKALTQWPGGAASAR